MSVVCIWALDPGHHSAIAQGRVWEEGSVIERLKGVQMFESETFEGDEIEQMRKLHRSWQDFQFRCRKAGLPYEMVIENFTLTRIKSSEREGLSPVRVTAAFLGYRHGLADAYNRAGFGPSRVASPIFQEPSAAMTHATDKRLKEWDLWLPGSAKEHERDAIRHFCLRVAKRAQRTYVREPS